MAKAPAKAKDTTATPSARPLVKLNAKAMANREVGPMVVQAFNKLDSDETKAHAMLGAVKSKRHDLLGKLTLGILAMAEADDSINLNASFSGEKQQVNFLNDQVLVGLGIREVTETEVKPKTGDPYTKQSFGWAKNVDKYFPSAKDKDGDAKRRKSTFRTNFLTQLKVCIQAAAGMQAKNIQAEFDSKAGTLMIAGPAVKTHFGTDKVHLDEKQTVGTGDKAVKLKAKPSFTEMKRLGAAAAGVAVTTRADSRTRAAPSAPPSGDAAFEALCVQLVTTVQRLHNGDDGLSPKQLDSLKKVQNAVNEVLG